VTAHTPGPWEQDPTGDIGWWAIGTNEKSVAHVVDEDRLLGLTKKEAKANARLIAAAPELLGALKAITERLTNERNAIANREGYIGDGELLPQVKAARAAIAKAEGK
jgi:hypothetical protein